MAEQDLTTRLSPEGRIVIPAEVRRRMNLRPGDVLHFGFGQSAGRVEIYTAQHVIDEMWSHNHGDAVDSTAAVRELRADDQQAQLESEARALAAAGEPWDEAAETSRLLDALGLA
jgi:AbrB family looped-hinge helix DNA binding protein